ncbi:hypothetical protein DXG01_000788 [Tephrocybe rancida]|nr:hypothetical protein DXG01_000788 [Tephrocybe rancida]
MPDDITQHKSSVPGAIVNEAENTVEAHYILSTGSASGGIERRTVFQQIMDVVARRNGVSGIEPFRGLSYRIRRSELMVQHKPPVIDVRSVPAITQPIRESRDEGENADDNTSITATVVAQEGDSLSRAEHLRRLMVEIQQELAES